MEVNVCDLLCNMTLLYGIAGLSVSFSAVALLLALSLRVLHTRSTDAMGNDVIINLLTGQKQ